MQAAINRPISVANVEGCAANGCDKDLADYFAIGKQKVKVADDFEKIMNGKVYQLMVGCGKEEYEALLKDVDGARITAMVATSSRYYTGKKEIKALA